MAREERQNFGEFIRLDEKDPELAERSGVKVWAIAAEAGSELSVQLVLDPGPVLAGEVIPQDDADDWRITVNRVNAQVRIPLPQIPLPGPGWHHLVGIWIAIEDTKEVHGVLYRVPPIEDGD